jgi:hypothetical protein
VSVQPKLALSAIPSVQVQGSLPQGDPVTTTNSLTRTL